MMKSFERFMDGFPWRLTFVGAALVVGILVAAIIVGNAWERNGRRWK